MSEYNNPPINNILEFDSILQHISALTQSVPAFHRIQTLMPLRDELLLSEALKRVAAMQALLNFDDPFPLRPFPDFQSAFSRADIEGAFLDAAIFRDLHIFLTMARVLSKYFSDRPEKYIELHPVSKRLIPLKELENAIAHVVDENGGVKDRASTRLSQIRRELTRIDSRIRSRMDALMSKMASAGYAQEENLVFRQGRSLIPMIESHRSRLQGVIVDQSQSGGTVFMEPLEVVELHNRMRRLESEEKDEIERILKELTARLRDVLPDVVENFSTVIDLDVLAAKARFGVKIRAVPAAIGPAGVLDLKNARHPLLLLKMDYEEVIPLTVSMDELRHTLIITGPNAGGKTVALKTVGLLSLMHIHGLPVPAAPKTILPLFHSIFADIGDRQSIEQDLSTFSSHIQEICHILNNADRHSLVLMDEIGSATDPAEGSALAQVILTSLTERSTITFATTHMGALKIFAHEAAGVENASMAFDQKTLRPSYRFQAGIPGSSYAFEIAERFGIDTAIIQDARNLLGEDRGHVEKLILHLEEELDRARKLRQDVVLKDTRLAGLTALYEDRLEKLKADGEVRRQAIIEEAEILLKEANSTVENLVRDIKEKQAGQDSVRSAKTALKLQQSAVSAMKKKENISSENIQTFEKGNWVIWEGHGSKGQVLSLQDRSGRVQVEINGLKMRLPMKDLRMAAAPQKKNITPVRLSVSTSDLSSEIDVRGMTGLEAVGIVDKYLSDANMSGLAQVTIIHGKGTGVLRKEIGRLLNGHSLVRTQRHGSWQEGDYGVTIVEFK
ncbi:endonuclease MutS2 [bacterium]|nr:endonuclease MutS2 [bacterium]